MPHAPSTVTRSGFFLIADLSGYTSFVTGNDLEHAQGVLNDLISLIIAQLGAPLEFVELEGDAVFVHARDETVTDAERLVEMLEVCYAAFRLRVEQMVRNTTCTCSACRAIGSLDLKCVGHHGRYATQATPRGPQLVGPDVTLVHRLLKNRVIESTGIAAYALLTEAFLARCTHARPGEGDTGAPALGLQAHEEMVESFGAVRGGVLDLAARVDRYRQGLHESLDALPVWLEITLPLTGSVPVAWGCITDPAMRPRWQTGIRSLRVKAAANGRTDAGWQGHCDHGNHVVQLSMLECRPFQRMTMDVRATGASPAKPPPCRVDFLFESPSETGCLLRFQIRLRQTGALWRLLFRLLRPLARREWSGHLHRLQQLLATEAARAAAGQGTSPEHGPAAR